MPFSSDFRMLISQQTMQLPSSVGQGMVADRCEINRQIRADNKMLRELKAQVAKLAQAVEKSIPIIAETLEAIRNHMIFTQYHLLHNEMQKEVIHDWMNHFNPILNKYNTVKKKLKAKVTERKELNVQKDKTSILNPMFSPIVHGNLNIRENKKCGEISLPELRKGHMIWNYNHHRVDNMLLQLSCLKGVWI